MSTWNTNLYLIRHGEAVVNVKPIVGGMRGDTGLTEHGVRQAESLRHRLATTHEIAADVLIASTLPRARQTAEMIAPALGLPVTPDDEVQEMHVGEADGMSNRDAWARYGMPIVDQDPFHHISPGGENWAEFMLRVGTALNRIGREHHGKTVVIVCHGGFIDGAFVYFLGMSPFHKPRASFYTYNTSITHWREYDRDATHQNPYWRLMLYNDTFHLREIGVSETINWRDISPVPDTSADHPSVPSSDENSEESN